MAVEQRLRAFVNGVHTMRVAATQSQPRRYRQITGMNNLPLELSYLAWRNAGFLSIENNRDG